MCRLLVVRKTDYFISLQWVNLFCFLFKTTYKTFDLSTDPERTPARNAIDARVQDLVASDELLMSILSAIAERICSLQATRSA